MSCKHRGLSLEFSGHSISNYVGFYFWPIFYCKKCQVNYLVHEGYHKNGSGRYSWKKDDVGKYGNSVGFTIYLFPEIKK